MAFEEKYKAIKPKYDLLKDAFKQLYGEHDALKVEICEKTKEFERLSEDHERLQQECARIQQEYSLLVDEIKDTKLQTGGSGSSWIDRIKKNVSLTDQNVITSLNDEIASLKSKLDIAIGDNELLQRQCTQAKRDLEDNKTEYSLIVSELKERYVALENVLHENQEQLKENETNLTKKDGQITAMNSELVAKSESIEKLTKRIESLNNYYKNSLKNKNHTEKFKFDPQRLTLLNHNDIYLQYNDLNSDGVSVLEFWNKIVGLFTTFFGSWKGVLKTVECSQVVTDSALITGFKDSLDVSGSKVEKNEEGLDGVDIESSNASRNCLELCRGIDAHLQEIGTILEIMARERFTLWYSHVPKLISHAKSFIRFQRIYFCVEEYLHPYNSQDLIKHTTKLLIQTLGNISRTVTKIHIKFQSIAFLTQKRSDEYFYHLLSTLLENNKSGETNSTDTQFPNDFNGTALGDVSSHDKPMSSGRTQKQVLENLDKFIGKSYKNLFVLTKRLANLMLELRQCLSQRLCHPKLVNNSFLPLCGGSSEMVSLTTCVGELNQYIPLFNERCLKSLLRSYIPSGVNNCDDENNPTIVYINSVNSSLVASQPRLKFDNLRDNLDIIRQHENTLHEWKEKVRTMEEELSIANIKCEQYESELEALKNTQEIELSCTRAFSRLEGVLSQSRKDSPGGIYTGKAETIHEKSSGNTEEIDTKKLIMHIKNLIKSINNLETHNKQLKMTIELNKLEYERAKENEDSLHRKYSEQLSYMNEHICELNNNILSSEYKIAELTQAKVQCPSCGFNNTLGSMVGSGNNKGKCSSCKGIVLHSAI